MADKGKKGKGGGDAAKKAAVATEKSSAKAEPVARVSEEVVKAEDHAHDDHDHDHDHDAKGHAHAAAHAPVAVHGHKPNIKEYLVIFAVLTVLTILEVALAQIPGISKKLLAIALVGLALTKAGIVGLYYMHLKSETRVLKLTVALPLAAPTIYALVLMSEAAWRLTR